MSMSMSISQLKARIGFGCDGGGRGGSSQPWQLGFNCVHCKEGMAVDVVALPAARYLHLPVATTQTNQPTKILLLLKKEGKEEE